MVRRPLAPDGRRASLYLRLSKAAGEENTSLEGMYADLLAHCAREGLEPIGPAHLDDGLSGGYRDRPGFQAWIADAREGRADVLLAWHVDRMTREGTNVAAILLDVVEGKDPVSGRPAHAPVRLMDTRGLDSNDGDSFRWRFVIAAEVARAERERIRDRARAKDERLRRAGRWAGGGAPFGYRIIDNPHGPGKTLAPDLGEVATVRRAVDKVLNHGWPVGRVSRWLNAEGYTPRRAAAWSPNTVRQVLTGDAVLGRMIVHGEVLRDDAGAALEVFPPILTLAQSRALRQALAQAPDATGQKGGRRPTRLLSGILQCHSCGKALQVARRTDGTVSYRCQTQSDGGVCAAQVVVSALPVEAWAEDFYLRHFGRLLETERRVVAEGSEDVAALDDAIAATLAALGKEATPKRFERLQALQARRAEAASAASARPCVVVVTHRSKASVWAAADTDGRREMFLHDVGRLTLGPGKRGRRGFDPARLIGLVRETPKGPASPRGAGDGA